MKCFEAARIYFAGKGILSGSVSFGERIERTDIADGERIELPSDCVVLPAFIDEHVHGCGGADAMDGTVEALEIISETLAKEGTARFSATTMTASEQATLAAVRAVKEYRRTRGAADSAVIGAHLEGPFISDKHIGAQPKEFVKSPDKKFFDALRKESGDNIRMITLAPEIADADALIKHISECGVTVSAGHTDATYADIERARKCGLSCVTHTYNAQRGIHHREIGTAGAALCDDGLYAEIIADGIHVSGAAIGLLLKNKPHDKPVLITDAMRAKGCADGVSELGGQTVYVKNGEARLADGTLAGSVLKMNDAVRFVVRSLGSGLCDAVDLATANPAKNLGIYGEYGSIEVGKYADFVVLDSMLDVVMTVRGGKIVFSRG